MMSIAASHRLLKKGRTSRKPCAGAVRMSTQRSNLDLIVDPPRYSHKREHDQGGQD